MSPSSTTFFLPRTAMQSNKILPSRTVRVSSSTCVLAPFIDSLHLNLFLPRDQYQKSGLTGCCTTTSFAHQASPISRHVPVFRQVSSVLDSNSIKWYWITTTVAEVSALRSRWKAIVLRGHHWKITPAIDFIQVSTVIIFYKEANSSGQRTRTKFINRIENCNRLWRVHFQVDLKVGHSENH